MKFSLVDETWPARQVRGRRRSSSWNPSVDLMEREVEEPDFFSTVVVFAVLLSETFTKVFQ